MYTLPEPRARSLRLEVGGEEFGASSFSSAGSDTEPSDGNTCELLGLEEVYLPAFERPDDGGREVRQAQVVIYEAGEGDLRRCFTLEDVLQPRHYSE